MFAAKTIGLVATSFVAPLFVDVVIPSTEAMVRLPVFEILISPEEFWNATVEMAVSSGFAAVPIPVAERRAKELPVLPTRFADRSLPSRIEPEVLVIETNPVVVWTLAIVILPGAEIVTLPEPASITTFSSITIVPPPSEAAVIKILPPFD